MSESFYVTLPSHSSKNEFPNNTANHFKIRLPQPLRLEGQGWKVGLSSIALPDANVTLPSLSDDVTLGYSSWRRIEILDHYTQGEVFTVRELKNVFSNVDGVGFMKSMIAFFEQRRIYNNSGPKFGAAYVTKERKRTYVKFKWEGDDLVTDNKDIF